MRKRGFTLIELLVVISIIALLIGILLPALGAARRTARRLENDTRLRGIQQACVTYANGNGTFYPGRASDGTEDKAPQVANQSVTHDCKVQTRFTILLENAYFTYDFVKSPLDPNPATAWTRGTLLSDYSYAMLQVPGLGTGTAATSGDRKTEWSDTVNTDAAVITDEDTGDNKGASKKSYHDDRKWIGSVAWNDNHVSFEQTQNSSKLCVLTTSKYGPQQWKDDDVWGTAATTADTGTTSQNPQQSNCRMINVDNAE